MSIDVLTVIGARPQLVKAAVVSAALQQAGLRESLIHTGQHYDDNMSAVFFRELGLPGPMRNLEIGGLSHGAMTGRMIEEIETIIVEMNPGVVLVYGDTNSTVAAALAAVKLHVPVAHVEAGMRSFNRRMPEEINRIVTDHIASYHFVTGETPRTHLAREGIAEGVYVVGDVMRDACERFLPIARKRHSELPVRGMSERFGVVTLHRSENTDDSSRLQDIARGLHLISERIPLVLPLHPRTKQRLARIGASMPASVEVIEPVGYLEMLALLDRCSLVITDSGGLQKEAFYVGRPCVTVRDETEWVETVELGWNRLVGADADAMLRACESFLDSPLPPRQRDIYGDGHAAERIARALAESSQLEARLDG
ncbi:MAG: UDP-N-acetylglucosamine 2-epimerase (non-hydrolyzing) [Myxococcales bacterium]|jgi:UDP-GlcNAc3NAcA epimerase